MIGEKLIIKMWETIVEGGVGFLASPFKIRREGKAHMDVRRDEILMLAQTELDVQAIREGKKKMLSNHTLVNSKVNDLLDIATIVEGRIEPTIDFSLLSEKVRTNIDMKNIQEEININKIIAFAEQELVDDQQEPPEQDIDPDWFTRWRDNAQKVRSEEVQLLWARVLAGEVKSPGAYSLRTLEFIKHISQHEANLISKLATYMISDGIHMEDRLKDVGIDYLMLLEMEDLGVISGVRVGGMNNYIKTLVKGHYEGYVKYNNKVLILSSPDEKKEVIFNCYKITKIGLEIFGLCDFRVDQLYLESVANKIKSQGVDVKIADLVATTPEGFQYSNAREL